MGCDIHLFVEAKKNGKWESVDAWELDGDYEPAELKVPYGKRFYTGRNYNLFAILAGVRNGSGFAGCDLGDRFNPISDPKGLPSDASPEVKKESDGWGVDGHSHSWHTLADILAYDWTQSTKHRGYVSAEDYASWRAWKKEKGEGPESFCGDVSGGLVEKIPVAVMEARVREIWDNNKTRADIDREIKKAMPHTYTRLEWEEPYYKSAESFWGTVIPRLLSLGAPDEVRIVFWFDN